VRVEQDFGIVPVDRVEFVVYVVLGSLAKVEIELDGRTIGMLHDQLDMVEMVPVPIPAYELVMGSPDFKKNHMSPQFFDTLSHTDHLLF